MLIINKVVSLVNEIYGRFYSVMNQFRRLRLGDLFPEMSKSDCMTLMAIDHFNQEKEEGILTVSELADKMSAQPSAVSRTLKNLEDRELIERTINKSDRRNTYVALSEKGKRQWKEMEATMGEFAAAVLSRMREEDLERLVSYLDELYQVAAAEIALRKNKNGKE